MRHTITALLSFLFLAIALGSAGEADPASMTITIAATADLHGDVMPWNYLRHEPADQGLAKVGTLIERLRQANPRTMFIDVGDTLQGNPFVYVAQQQEPAQVNPMIGALNLLRCDAMVVGNHDFNLGSAYLAKAEQEAHFPFLGANVLTATGPRFLPYIIREFGPVRVAIVGLTTPRIPTWEDREHYAGLTFAPPFVLAERTVRKVKQLGVHVVILATHFGLGKSTFSDQTGSGADYIHSGSEDDSLLALSMAERIPGVDGVFMAHSHRQECLETAKGIPLVQPAAYGRFLAVIDIHLECLRDDFWIVTKRKGKIVTVDRTVPARPELIDRFSALHDRVLQYLDTPVATLAAAIDVEDAGVRDNPLIDSLLSAQCRKAGADISFAALPPFWAGVATGTMRIRDLFRLYPYDNTLHLVELSGAQIHEILEYAAGYFLPWDHQTCRKDLINPAIRAYNFDQANGIGYTIDLRLPLGQRVTDLTWRGRPLAPSQTLTAAVNSYRYNGGGGYSWFKRARHLRRIPLTVRDIWLEYLQQGGKIPARADDNWRVLPAAAADLPFQ